MSEAAANSMGLDLFARDASGQRPFSIKNFSPTAKIDDLVKALIPQMGLSTKDTAGRPLNYQAFSERDKLHLRSSDSVADVLRQGDEISLLPDIQAG